MILCVDPSVADVGVAIFEDRELVVAWLTRAKGWRTMGHLVVADAAELVPLEAIDQVVVEIPKVYKEPQQKGPQEDVIKVALAAGTLGSAIGQNIPIHTYEPWEWKAQVPKQPMVRRIKKRLSREEHDRIDLPARAKSKWHNVYDACGIGLRFVGRL